jgi:hypothetical protein
LQFLTANQLPGTLNQKPQHADGLALNMEANSMLMDFTGLKINPKRAKDTNRMGIRHSHSRSAGSSANVDVERDASMMRSTQQLRISAEQGSQVEIKRCCHNGLCP